eukprot:TRINITY_DN4328_c0_g1_i1.p1 TRINITY_DN4328_c0_g1~~TRINITY_DN4328_c0_g1_i1.p1  ORF type:complete len:630 (+),score=202.09 TRINITY_DN4328_c0_g1_i1:108-1892(+)
MRALLLFVACASAYLPKMEEMSRHIRGGHEEAVRRLGGNLKDTPTYTETDVRIPTRDGQVLYTRLFFPQGAHKISGKAAAVFQQVPYSLSYHKQMVLSFWLLVLQGNCSVVLALQETRSRYNSTGDFDMFRLSANDAQDSYEWIAKQSWSNGVLFPWGISAMGIKAFLTGGANFTIRGQSIGIASPSFHNPVVYRGGALNTGIIDTMLPFTNISIQTVAPDIVQHEAPGPWWNANTFSDFEKVSWPSVQWAGWFDIFLQQSITAFDKYWSEGSVLTRTSHRLVIDPLGHCGLRGHASYYNETALNLTQMLWFGGTVGMFTVFKDVTNTIENGIALAKWNFLVSSIPTYTFYVMGTGGHYLAGVDNWPAVTPSEMYLAPGQKLTTATPASGNVSYDYDPSNPVPTFGGTQFQSPLVPCGALDQTLIGPRDDIVHFTASPLSATMAITGHVTATLEVSSNCSDTDFMVKLVDVYPNGTRQLITDGVQRMRWRDGAKTATMMTPGQRYTVTVDMWSTSWIFAAGHAVGVDVTSSSSPGYRPNQNTGKPLPEHGLIPALGGSNVTAHNTVHFGKSMVTLPTVKVSDLTPLPPINFPPH